MAVIHVNCRSSPWSLRTGGVGSGEASAVIEARRALQATENEAAEREGREPVELPHMVTHDLRHFFASALLAGGASVSRSRCSSATRPSS